MLMSARACRRAMEFIIDLLRRLHDDRQVDLPAAATAAYEETLHPFHGWITSSVFTLAMKVCFDQRGCARRYQHVGSMGQVGAASSHQILRHVQWLAQVEPCALA